MFEWPIRIYYEDTDALGIVYYANYLKFFERARTEWLRHLGFEQDKMIGEGIGFAVVSAQIDYKKPAKFNDQLTVVTRLASHTKASFNFAQEILAKDNKPLVLGEIKVCCLKLPTLAPRAIPKLLIEEMKRAC